MLAPLTANKIRSNTCNLSTVNATCYHHRGSEAASDVISGHNVKNVEYEILVNFENFEVAGCSSFRDFRTKSLLRDVGDGDGAAAADIDDTIMRNAYAN